MAHFAKIGIDNTVLEILVVNDNNCMSPQGLVQEEIGVEFLRNLTGHQAWKQTYFDNSFRKRFAAVGYTYNSDLDAFIPPKPYPSWTLDTENATWISPTPMPTGVDRTYSWNEQILSWQEFV